MKAFLFSLLLLPALLRADPLHLQFRVGYFYPTSGFVQDIYRNGGLAYELEGFYHFAPRFAAFANVNGFVKHGYTVGLRDKTTLTLFPVSAGLKFLHPLNEWFTLYAGLGPSFTFVHTYDQSPFVSSPINRNVWGGVAKAGVLYFFRPCLFFDLYADYYYSPVKSTDDWVNLGGVHSGIGVGVIF